MRRSSPNYVIDADVGDGAAKATGKTHSRTVYERLRQRILDREFPPGLELLEVEISQVFGVSRTPVRDAILRLERDGLVEVRPRKGIRVTAISSDDMREIYELLTCVEAMSAGLAARQGMSAGGLQKLRLATRAMEDALASSDLSRWAEADDRFHMEVVKGSRNNRLIAFATSLLDQSRRSRLATLRLRPYPTRSNSEHQHIVEAISNRKEEEAHDAMFQHRLTHTRTLISILKKYKLDHI